MTTDRRHEGALVLGGFKLQLLADLVRDGLSSTVTESIPAAGRTVEVTRLRTTDVGRQVLAENRGTDGEADHAVRCRHGAHGERIIVFCAASETDWVHAGIPAGDRHLCGGEGVGLARWGRAIALTDRGRAVLRAMLPGL
jgi:hypothetical protein